MKINWNRTPHKVAWLKPEWRLRKFQQTFPLIDIFPTLKAVVGPDFSFISLTNMRLKILNALSKIFVFVLQCSKKCALIRKSGRYPALITLQCFPLKDNIVSTLSIHTSTNPIISTSLKIMKSWRIINRLLCRPLFILIVTSQCC